MQTNLADFITNTPAGREADAILRTCVHCGFCTATCPTFQLLGDELDGPRGRIYLIKQMLEGQPVTERTQLHLDRCLSCRACETTCPSGVRYHRLLEIGREVIEERVPRSLAARATHFLLREAVPRGWIFKPAVRMGQLMRPLLPARPGRQGADGRCRAAKPWPRPAARPRRMIALAGCVQPTLTPNTNAATARVLDRLGIELFEVPGAGLLRRPALPPQCPGKGARRHAAGDRRLVAAGRERARRGLRDDRVGLRRACARVRRTAQGTIRPTPKRRRELLP